MGRQNKKALTHESENVNGNMQITFDKSVVDDVARIPSFLKKPFGRFKGLTRYNDGLIIITKTTTKKDALE